MVARNNLDPIGVNVWLSILCHKSTSEIYEKIHEPKTRMDGSLVCHVADKFEIPDGVGID